MHKWGILFLLMTLATFDQGCGSTSNPPGTIDAASTRCNSGVAQISVGDGFLRIFCGCTGPGETAGTVFSTPGRLTCHLPSSNSQVFFYFLGTVLHHQIVPNGSNKFPSSPVSDPSSSSQVRSYAISFPQAATTYDFQDIYGGMTGQIFVP